MNISLPLGMAFAVFVVYSTIRGEIKNPEIFLSPHAATMVLGGTLAAALICFPLGHFFNLFRVFLRTLTGQGHRVMVETINDVVRLSALVNEGHPIQADVSKVRNPFLRECLELLASGGLSEEELEEVLEKRVEQQNEKYKREGNTFKIIGKFPPAFGLIGASMGMIALLQGLGEPNAFERLGPSMAVALVATFYGLILANFILIPIGENLAQGAEEDLAMRRAVIDGVRLIKDGKHPLLVEEYLKSYLAPRERNKMKKFAGGEA